MLEKVTTNIGGLKNDIHQERVQNQYVCENMMSVKNTKRAT